MAGTRLAVKPHEAWVVVIVLTWCGSAPICSAETGDRITSVIVHSREVNEASGLAASRRHPHILYTHNDSGGRPRIYAIDARNGRLQARLDINRARNSDWEDIAVGPGPGGESYIYIGDTGGNTVPASNTIYRLREPLVIQDSLLEYQAMLKYSWPEKNCETLMVDEEGSVYLVPKVKINIVPKLYKIPHSDWSNHGTVSLRTGISFNIFHTTRGPVSGDISYNGNDILIKTYNIVYYWQRNASDTVATAIKREPLVLPYHEEPQGEAICWSSDASTYFTLSEGVNQRLYSYPRTNGTALQVQTRQILDSNTASSYRPILPILELSLLIILII